MADWTDLEREIGAWRAVGEAPTFWWRDDDAQAPTPELERLITLSERFDAALHLAVIPQGISPDLAARLRTSPTVWAMQHGFAHKNHEPDGLRASEVGVSRDLALQRADLQEGWRLLQAADLPRLISCVVPPWNRMADRTRMALPSMGFAMLSAFEGPTTNTPVPGLVQVHSHFDPVRWKGGARFRGLDKTLAMVVEHLADRRMGRVPKDTATGLLTHHLQTDEATWAFVEEFCDRVARRGAGTWVPVAGLLNRT
jgi:hypothetical protein